MNTQPTPAPPARYADIEMIDAVRMDHIVGRGTCSVIDECYSNAELLAALAAARIRSASGALRWARSTHKMWKDQMDDIMATAW